MKYKITHISYSFKYRNRRAGFATAPEGQVSGSQGFKCLPKLLAAQVKPAALYVMTKWASMGFPQNVITSTARAV